MTQNTDALVTWPRDEPTWKQRAVERSTRAAKLRAEQRVERFLDAAQAIITEKGGTDFTVQEVVDRSRQSLRSFYQHFDGKHELLLALLEDALRRATDQIAAVLTMETVMFAAQASEGAGPEGSDVRPITADEIWDFCAHGIAGG
jgi:AcrR family transcriptional regulator